MVLHLLVEGEVIEFVKVLQKPQVIMKLHSLLVLQGLAQVDELQVYLMHVHVLSLALLGRKLRLLKRGQEGDPSEVVH